MPRPRRLPALRAVAGVLPLVVAMILARSGFALP